jgi:hypothetical protein
MSLDKTILGSLEQQSRAPRYGQKQSEITSPFELLGSLIGSLTRRVEELERRPTLRYLGIWDEAKEYAAGCFVTTNGSLWYCEERTRSRPGTDSTWRLAVKRGTTS